MMLNISEQHQYFAIFQQPNWEFDHHVDFKKLVSYCTAGIHSLQRVFIPSFQIIPPSSIPPLKSL